MYSMYSMYSVYSVYSVYPMATVTSPDQTVRSDQRAVNVHDSVTLAGRRANGQKSSRPVVVEHFLLAHWRVVILPLPGANH